MKRLALWVINLALLMMLSATSALSSPATFQALDTAELHAVTAGICSTCADDEEEEPDPHPYVVSENWELTSQRQSTPTVIKRSPIDTFPNGGATPLKVNLSYSDGCRRIITGGSVSFARSIGISLNTVYHCDRTRTFDFTVLPGSTATLYEGTMRYYTTYTYRLVLRWSDGYRENTGLTETIREETTYDFLEVR